MHYKLFYKKEKLLTVQSNWLPTTALLTLALQYLHICEQFLSTIACCIALAACTLAGAPTQEKCLKLNLEWFGKI